MSTGVSPGIPGVRIGRGSKDLVRAYGAFLKNKPQDPVRNQVSYPKDRGLGPPRGSEENDPTTSGDDSYDLR